MNTTRITPKMRQELLILSSADDLELQRGFAYGDEPSAFLSWDRDVATVAELRAACPPFVKWESWNEVATCVVELMTRAGSLANYAGITPEALYRILAEERGGKTPHFRASVDFDLDIWSWCCIDGTWRADAFDALTFETWKSWGNTAVEAVQALMSQLAAAAEKPRVLSENMQTALRLAGLKHSL
jgi:hypothetical protein